MSLNDIIKEAEKMGLSTGEIETTKRQYYAGVTRYDDTHKETIDVHRYGSAIISIKNHYDNMELYGEACARKYLKQVTDSAQKQAKEENK